MRSSEPYQVVKAHGLDSDQPSLAALNDQSKVTPEEVRSIYDLHQNFIIPCRTIYLEMAAQISPTHVAAFANWFAQSDATYSALTQGKITWGQAVQQFQAHLRESKVAISQADTQVRQALGQSHNAEVARRQQAAAALSNYAYQQQVLVQNQQMIIAAYRPRTTNCQYVGAYLTCTTY